MRASRWRRFLVGTVAFALVGALATAARGSTTHPSPASATGRLYTLPTGDQVSVSGTGVAARVRLLPASGRPTASVTSIVNGQTTVVPVGQFGHISSLSGFEVGGNGAVTARPQFAMAPLNVKALDHAGKPAAAAEVVVVNTDDPTKANWDGIMTGGDARIQVPAGHYSVAVAVFDTDAKGNSTETDLLSVTDLTVPAAGTTVMLDGRTASRVSVATPRPTVNADTVVGWVRGKGENLDVLDVGALPGTPLYVGAAGPARYGVLTYSVVARQVSPAPGYTYLFAEPELDHVPASQAYTMSAATLATVDSTYVTDTPAQQLYLWDDFDLTSEGPTDPALPTLSFVLGNAPSTDRRYISTGTNLRYDGLMLPVPNASLDNELERPLRLVAGEHLALTWNGGLIVPAPATVDGPCFLCREGDVLHGLDPMDTDASGDIGQWSDGPTTLTQDGKTIYTGTTMGTLFDQALPAGRHRYVYAMDTTHGTEQTALSTHSLIAWGFYSQHVSGSAPVPILYANAWFEADGHESVAPGTGVFEMALEHQPGVPDAAVSAATVEVSYDDGATWTPLSLTMPDAHHVPGTWHVPAGVRPGYLTVRLHAVDTAGSTVDETVTHAALVNAPGGIALPPAGGAGAPAPARAVCPQARSGFARCFALVSSVAPAKRAAAKPDGLARADLVSAYRLPTSGGAGRTVAIVDAHDDPTAEADLAVYRKAYGLPACTTANGCFAKVNQRGRTSPLPAYDPEDDWSVDVALDLYMVSAVCPACHILLVEADDSSVAALGTAEKAATGSGAVAVSNSWGSDEGTEELAYTGNFHHAGVAVTVSSGDSGFQEAQWPASLGTVIAVGGTSLSKASGARGWRESAWSGAGSGCSAYVAKPSWQKDTHCGMRTASDISAVADPNTGLAVYAQGSWLVVGGTSASSPMVAAMIALAGNPSALSSAKYIYAHAASLNDVTTGSNANWNCGGDYLCTATKGYDGPTGVGTPAGLGAL